MKLRFLYHAEAVGATGSITLPFQETMEIQASVALPLNGGHGTSRVENFRHRHIFSFRSAEAQVVGSYSAKDQAHGTLSTVTVEELNILDVVTCDRLVARLTSKHSDDGADASFIPLGSRFENLRIAGHKIELDLATDLFTELSTWSKLSDGYAKDAKIRSELAGLSLSETKGKALPERKGIFGCTLARNLDKLPGNLTRNGHGIYVPHFGTVYLGEFFVSAVSRRLLMLHVDLGCSVEGCYGSGGTGGNGSIWS
jgi:hypothetical protein